MHETAEFRCDPHPLNNIKKTIAVLSGKGGVGKSLVTALLATYLQRTGNYKVGILDADITGPSVPKLFGAEEWKPKMTEEGILPVRSHSDIQLMSINLLIEDPSRPVVWRGPILGNTVKQFWSDVIWGELDFLLIDMPPGTGDVPLTVFQSLPVDGIIIVTSPQDLVSLIVRKAIHMARMMSIPVIGLVENMSHVLCPECGHKIELFGESHTAAVASEFNIPLLDSLPIDPEITKLADTGSIEKLAKMYLNNSLQEMVKMLPEKNKRKTGKSEQMTKDDAITDSSTADRIIAVAMENGQIAEHFGHCDGFTLFTIQNNQLADERFIESPPHKPGLLPVFLKEKGVTAIIAGGMGAGAIDLFRENDIEVVTGIRGDPREAAREFLTGSLISTDEACREHAHGDSCGS